MFLAIVYLASDFIAFDIVSYSLVGNKIVTFFKEEIVKLFSWLNVLKLQGFYRRLFVFNLQQRISNFQRLRVDLNLVLSVPPIATKKQMIRSSFDNSLIF